MVTIDNCFLVFLEGVPTTISNRRKELNFLFEFIEGPNENNKTRFSYEEDCYQIDFD